MKTIYVLIIITVLSLTWLFITLNVEYHNYTKILKYKIGDTIYLENIQIINGNDTLNYYGILRAKLTNK